MSLTDNREAPASDSFNPPPRANQTNLWKGIAIGIAVAVAGLLVIGAVITMMSNHANRQLIKTLITPSTVAQPAQSGTPSDQSAQANSAPPTTLPQVTGPSTATGQDLYGLMLQNDLCGPWANAHSPIFGGSGDITNGPAVGLQLSPLSSQPGIQLGSKVVVYAGATLGYSNHGAISDWLLTANGWQFIGCNTSLSDQQP